MDKVGKVSYHVQLPAWLKIHPIFYTSCLKPYHADREDPSRNISTRPPQFPQSRGELTKFWRTEYGSYPCGAVERKFLIKWKNLPKVEASWELEDALWHEEDRIKEYQQKTLADTLG
uniref:Chromo domain-containing protein n=1 Tax=Ananas comosus var. bracteatus TaxID=296719 RepID=A0A6V7NH09_ANACO|nr:unnamed protein product [Ananas comosus var. bracteatus]